MATTLTYETIPARALSGEHLATWRALIPPTGDLASPFFCPEYTQAVGAVRNGVEVCLVRDGSSVVGLFPFERVNESVGRPVGGSMSNFQGMLAVPGTSWSAEDLMRSAKLGVLKFHHLVHDQRPLEEYIERRVSSPFVSLAGGWDTYLAARREAGVSSFNALPRKMRKLEREVGPLRFESSTLDSDVLARLVEWKRAQYVRTNTRGSLSHDWGVEVFRKLMVVQQPGFAGTLSALYAGDQLIAAHAGMRSASVWHYWFPAYDPSMSHHSPGLVLMFEMCKWACHAGLRRIDLGPGDGAHKDLFASAETEVGIGQVEAPQRVSFLSRLMNRWRTRQMA